MEQVRGHRNDAGRHTGPVTPIRVVGPGVASPHPVPPAGFPVPTPRFEGQHLSYPPMPAPMPAPMPWPTPAPAPAASSSGAVRALAVVAMTVLALAALVLAGVLLYPLLTATPGTPVTTVSSPAAAPSVVSPAPSSGSTTGIYSCGTANGYSIAVQNGNVPCTSARWVTTMWTTDGTTPANGTGSAGTPYSWTCSSTGGADTVGQCVSKMGSTFTISR